MNNGLCGNDDNKYHYCRDLYEAIRVSGWVFVHKFYFLLVSSDIDFIYCFLLDL